MGEFRRRGRAWEKSIRALGVIALIALGGATADAQSATYQAPDLSWGVPDLGGAWTTASVTTLERPPGVTTLVLTPEQARDVEQSNFHNVRAREDQKPLDPGAGAPAKGAILPPVGNYSTAYIDAGTKVARVKGELRSSWIVDPLDGKVPFSGAGRLYDAKIKFASNGTPADPADGYLGPESRGWSERCIWIVGPIMLNSIYNSNYQIVQSPDAVVIDVEMVHDARIIPIVKSAADAANRFGPKAIPKWLGDSVGWYEGKTLVVETRNVMAKQATAVTLTPDGVATERFTRVGPDELLYEFQVDDPALYTQPWRGEMQIRRLNGPVYEYACHEGNYGLVNILLGARMLEARGVKLKHSGFEE